MKIHRKLAGRAWTIGDLEEFIARAKSEGFTTESYLNPQGQLPEFATHAQAGISIFLQEVSGSGPEDCIVDGECPKCNSRGPVKQLGSRGVWVMDSHKYRHSDNGSQCSGVGDKALKVHT